MKKSTFMRKFFRSAYEDSLYRLIKRNPEGVEANRERLDRREEFFELLKERDPELLDKYDNLIDSFLHFENVLFEEFYILGVQDRDKAFMLQK